MSERMVGWGEKKNGEITINVLKSYEGYKVVAVGMPFVLYTSIPGVYKYHIEAVMNVLIDTGKKIFKGYAEIERTRWGPKKPEHREVTIYVTEEADEKPGGAIPISQFIKDMLTR